MSNDTFALQLHTNVVSVYVLIGLANMICGHFKQLIVRQCMCCNCVVCNLWSFLIINHCRVIHPVELQLVRNTCAIFVLSLLRRKKWMV